MTGPILVVDALTCGYGDSPVVRGVSLTVSPGEVVALLGANGAGKTTCLRAFSGLLPISGGDVLYQGKSIAGRAPQRLAREELAHVVEGRGIFFGLTVAEHFRLGYRGERVDVDQAFAYFPALDRLRTRRAGLLSGGEQQMLALARALARRPKLLLIDELSMGLAPVIVDQLLPVVRRFATESGTAVLLVEQHVHRALEIADRAYVLAHGAMVMSGVAADLLHDPELLAASYLGQNAD